MNVLDEITQSHLHQGNFKFNQTRYTIQTWDHEYVNLEVFRLFSRVYAFYEEEGHVIMDCPFVLFHSEVGITKHVEL